MASAWIIHATSTIETKQLAGVIKKTILKGLQSENLKDFHLKLKEVSQFYNKMPTGSSSAKDEKDCLRYTTARELNNLQATIRRLPMRKILLSVSDNYLGCGFKLLKNELNSSIRYCCPFRRGITAS